MFFVLPNQDPNANQAVLWGGEGIPILESIWIPESTVTTVNTTALVIYKQNPQQRLRGPHIALSTRPQEWGEAVVVARLRWPCGASDDMTTMTLRPSTVCPSVLAHRAPADASAAAAAV